MFKQPAHRTFSNYLTNFKHQLFTAANDLHIDHLLEEHYAKVRQFESNYRVGLPEVVFVLSEENVLKFLKTLSKYLNQKQLNKVTKTLDKLYTELLRSCIYSGVEEDVYAYDNVLHCLKTLRNYKDVIWYYDPWEKYPAQVKIRKTVFE